MTADEKLELKNTEINEINSSLMEKGILWHFFKDQELIIAPLIITYLSGINSAFDPLLKVMSNIGFSTEITLMIKHIIILLMDFALFWSALKYGRSNDQQHMLEKISKLPLGKSAELVLQKTKKPEEYRGILHFTRNSPFFVVVLLLLAVHMFAEAMMFSGWLPRS